MSCVCVGNILLETDVLKPTASEPKPQVPEEPKETPVVVAKPEPKPQPKPEPKVIPQPESKPEPKPQPKPEPKVIPQPEIKPETKATPKPEPKPETELKPAVTKKVEAASVKGIVCDYCVFLCCCKCLSIYMCVCHVYVVCGYLKSYSSSCSIWDNIVPFTLYLWVYYMPLCV